MMSSHQLPYGLLNINKPGGVTSRKEINKVQRGFKPAKVGHAGTLDPMARGVLVTCIGQATRLVPYLQLSSKTYLAEFQFGLTTTTDDITGDIITQADVPSLSTEEIHLQCERFRGTIQQIPPQVSAVHVDGKRAYALAREGEKMDLKPKEVNIHELNIISYEEPRLKLEIVCSSGTYIRSIARDLGELIGCGATMTALTRSAIGDFRIEDAMTLLDKINKSEFASKLIPAKTAIHSNLHLKVSRKAYKDIMQGKPIKLDYILEQFPVSPHIKRSSDNPDLYAILDEEGNDLIAVTHNVFFTARIFTTGTASKNCNE